MEAMGDFPLGPKTSRVSMLLARGGGIAIAETFLAAANKQASRDSPTLVLFVAIGTSEPAQVLIARELAGQLKFS